MICKTCQQEAAQVEVRTRTDGSVYRRYRCALGHVTGTNSIDHQTTSWASDGKRGRRKLDNPKPGQKDIMSHIQAGQKLKLKAFGDAVVRRMYRHPDTNELVADVKVVNRNGDGDIMHLSIAYVDKLMREMP